MAVLALLSVHELLDERVAHLLTEDGAVLRVVVAGGHQGGEQHGAQLGLGEVREGQIAQLLQNGRLVARLQDRLRKEG